MALRRTSVSTPMNSAGIIGISAYQELSKVSVSPQLVVFSSIVFALAVKVLHYVFLK